MRYANERELLANTIERFASGEAGPYEWDDVVGIAFSDGGLESIRQDCLAVQERFPPLRKGEYCSDEGVAYLRNVAARLRHGV